MTMDEHIDCDRQLNEAEDRIKELESAATTNSIVANALNERIKKLEAENEQLKKWRIKPTEAICLTDLSCRYKKVFKND